MNYPDDFDNLIVSNRDSFAKLPNPIQVAYCLHQLEAQVNNGGFHAFFGNSSGRFTPETITALEKIGAFESKKLLEQAIYIAYKNGFPTNPELYECALSDFSIVGDALAPLEKLFWSYPEPLPDLVNSYLSKNA
jgi:Domain of unknown function (DUF4375)